MGDYNKLIVACTLKPSAKEELDSKIKELNLYTSAYQSQELVVSVLPSAWHSGCINLVLVGQTKLVASQNDFCAWLYAHVKQGSGHSDIYAMSFSEHSDIPQVWKLLNEEDSDVY